MLSYKKGFESSFVVGNNHHVDISAIDSFVIQEIEKTVEDNNKLLIIDQLGPIQFLSQKFITLIQEVLRNKADLLATIVYKSSPVGDKIKLANNILLIEITNENRNSLPTLLLKLFSKKEKIEQLSTSQKQVFFELFKRYLSYDQSIQIDKLLNKAIGYVLNQKVQKQGRSFTVLGEHANHQVELNPSTCDCDLFNGKNKYLGKAGECSHLQAVKMYSALI